MTTELRDTERRDAAGPTPTPPRPGKALTIGAVCKILQAEFHEGDTVRVDFDGEGLTFTSVVEGEAVPA